MNYDALNAFYDKIGINSFYNNLNTLKAKYNLQYLHSNIIRIPDGDIRHNSLRIIFNNNELVKTITESNNVIYKLFKASGKNNNTNYITQSISDSTHNRIVSTVLVKIRSYEESSVIFGYKPTKKEMFESGNFFNIEDFDVQYLCKKDGKIRDVIVIKYKNRAFKFSIDDVEFHYPDIEKLLNLKGYNKPKDRKIRIGDNVILRNNKGTRFQLKQKFKVTGTLNIGGNKYASVTADNLNTIITQRKLKKIV